MPFVPELTFGPWASGMQTDPPRPYRTIQAYSGGGDVLWTPANLAVAPVAWWDAADEATITLASGSFAAGGPVSAWANKGSGGGSATQATGSKQPAFSRTGFNINKSALTFAKASSQTLDFGAIAPQGANPSALFVVSNSSDIDGQFRFIISWGARAGNDQRGISKNSSSMYYAGVYFTDVVSTITSTTASVLAFSAGVADGARFWINGTSIGATAVPSMNTSSAAGYIGSSSDVAHSHWNGPISEVIVLGYLPTTDQRQRLEGYLAWRWGTQSSLAASNPWSTSNLNRAPYVSDP